MNNVVNVLNHTHLIQRLRKPINKQNNLSALGEAFAFGGGLKNGGLSSEAMDLLRPLFSFDYMGSSEFEWGAIPKFFEYIATNNKSYCGYKIKIQEKDVFVVCDTSYSTLIFKRIKEIAKKKVFLKDPSMFDFALNPSRDYHYDYVGWLELDNHFMFFTDEQIYNSVLLLFSIPRCEN